MAGSVWKFTLLGAAIVVSLTACAQDKGSDKEKPSVSASPKQVFSNNCSSCHGDQLQGGMGPDLRKIGSRYSAKEIAAVIENGQGQMPPQKQLNANSRKKLANWLAKKK
ncbi:cytochrome c551/cytochrome c550 [Marininema mesophilum]|uniref:Cytochrome c551/cytochrome c550 n=1 Tax=Marininema mesophilum TaxID=1048340 RepID=A0A1H2TK36_9BACL|nr:cytochrome c [Marininema mesophilum]SDW44170.1 cytochrome c551/cytochrome c550 [Marininema mesophilum]